MRPLASPPVLNALVRESPTVASRLLDQVPEPLLLVQRTPGSLKALYLNPAFQEVVGHPLHEWGNSWRWLERLSPDPAEREQIRDDWTRRLVAAEVYHQEQISGPLSLFCRDKVWRHFELQVNRLEHQLYLLVLQPLRDENVQRLEHINRHQQQLFSLIAHDLKGPMGSLLTTLELYHSKMLSPEELHRMAELSLPAVRQCFTTLSNLLEWSRSQLQGLHAHPAPLALRPLAERVLAFTQEAAEHKAIALQLDVPEESLLWSDEHILEIVLRNLIQNAIKFTAPQGQVRLCARREEACLRVEVQDSGQGIPAEALETLWADLPATSQLGTSGERGTGLGLQLCQSLLSSLGVVMQFSCPLQGGSRITLMLPLSGGAYGASPAIPAIPSGTEC